ncbi:hypothetical protein AGMMS49525_15530 [Bacteroidia bacterium]|nr:hypothetical protein AGMMS49525_15530 [Bacteroidia bacterium]
MQKKILKLSVISVLTLCMAACGEKVKQENQNLSQKDMKLILGNQGGGKYFTYKGIAK